METINTNKEATNSSKNNVKKKTIKINSKLEELKNKEKKIKEELALQKRKVKQQKKNFIGKTFLPIFDKYKITEEFFEKTQENQDFPEKFLEVIEKAIIENKSNFVSFEMYQAEKDE